MNGLGIKRLVFGVLLVTLVGYLGAGLLRELSSPEDRVRYALEDAIDEFNDRDLDVMRLFADDYEDEETRTDRRKLREGMQWVLWWGGHRHSRPARRAAGHRAARRRARAGLGRDRCLARGQGRRSLVGHPRHPRLRGARPRLEGRPQPERQSPRAGELSPSYARVSAINAYAVP